MIGMVRIDQFHWHLFPQFLECPESRSLRVGTTPPFRFLTSQRVGVVRVLPFTALILLLSERIRRAFFPQTFPLQNPSSPPQFLASFFLWVEGSLFFVFSSRFMFIVCYPQPSLYISSRISFLPPRLFSCPSVCLLRPCW